MNTLEKFEKKHLKELQLDKKLPSFSSGDTIKVHLRVKEGEKERIQVFEGVCIAKKNAGINSSFTVRKISYGEGIERVIPLFSPQVSKIEVVKSGSVRRSKLYYLRERSGKSARIAEKNVFTQSTNKTLVDDKKSQTESVDEKKSETESVDEKKTASEPVDKNKSLTESLDEKK